MTCQGRAAGAGSLLEQGVKQILPDPLLKGFDAAVLGKGGILLVANRGC